MTLFAPAALLLIAWSAAPAEKADRIQYAQLRVERQVSIRIRRTPAPAQSRVVWREGTGPECLRRDAIVGVAMLGPQSVDFLLSKERRYRAKLAGSCPALDFYYGFYMEDTQDGKLCAERDSIRSRIGSQCTIESFHRLEAQPRE